METVPISKSIRLINLGMVESWQTQAVYHAIAERMTEDSADTIIICQPATPYLSIGHFQKLDSVFDHRQVEKLGLPVYSRRIGGGATFLDKNQLFYQFVFHHSRVPVVLEKTYKIFLAAPVHTLKSFGLDCKLRALNEIELNGKRIAGIGGGRIGDAAVVVGNFLFDFDFETMSSVWKSPWSGYKALASEALKERICTLKQCAPGLSIEKVSARLTEGLTNYFDRQIKECHLTKEEFKGAQIESQQLSVNYNKPENEVDLENQKRPLKISADVYIYNKKIKENRHSFNLSFRTDKELITKVKAEKFKLEAKKALLNQHYKEANKIINQI